MLVHATAIAFDSRGVLLRGPPGSGKSSLALRLIDCEGFGLAGERLRARLIADDQVEAVSDGEGVRLSPPAALAGLLEIRGWGIVTTPYVTGIPLCLIADLTPVSAIERMPQPGETSVEFAGLIIPRLMLDGKAPDAAARLRAALTCRVA